MRKKRIYERHGDTGTRLHRIWKGMKGRCNNPNWKPYERYGAVGIKVYPEWENSYTTFKTWALTNGYSDELELDRIDNNGDYEPSNCRWVTHYEQTMNRCDTLYATYDGITITLKEFRERFGINRNTCANWRHLGILEEKLFEVTGKKVAITGGKTSN